MTEKSKNIFNGIALDSLSITGTFKKSLTGADLLGPKPGPIASVVVAPITTAPVNSTTAPTPTASLSTGPKK